MDYLQHYIFHWRPEKALYFSDRSLLWDARCSGIYVGFAIGTLWHFFQKPKPANLPPIRWLTPTLLLFAPLGLDVLTLYFEWRLPSNNIRYITGLFFGTALSVIVCPAVISLFLKHSDYSATQSDFSFRALISIICISSILVFSDNIFIYWLLYVLSVFGFTSLAVFLITGFVLVPLNMNKSS